MKIPKNWPDPAVMADRRKKYGMREHPDGYSVLDVVPKVLHDLPVFAQLGAEYDAVDAARIRVVAEQHRWEADRDRKLKAHEDAVRAAVAAGRPIPDPPAIAPLPYLVDRKTDYSTMAAQDLVTRGLKPQDVTTVNLAAAEYEEILGVLVATAHGIMRERAEELIAHVRTLAKPFRDRIRDAEQVIAEAQEAVTPHERAEEALHRLIPEPAESPTATPGPAAGGVAVMPANNDALDHFQSRKARGAAGDAYEREVAKLAARTTRADASGFGRLAGRR